MLLLLLLLLLSRPPVEEVRGPEGELGQRDLLFSRVDRP